MGLRSGDAIKGDLRACPSRPVKSLVQTPGVLDTGGSRVLSAGVASVGAVPGLGG
jgi:hypothetical protein